MGTGGRSGEDWDCWQAVYGPVGANGYFQPVFDPATGAIDHGVAAYWKEHTDLNAYLQRHWKEIGPRLAGKIHIWIGDMDTYYLNDAVHLLDDYLATTKEPAWGGSITYGPREPHCWSGTVHALRADPDDGRLRRGERALRGPPGIASALSSERTRAWTRAAGAAARRGSSWSRPSASGRSTGTSGGSARIGRRAVRSGRSASSRDPRPLQLGPVPSVTNPVLSSRDVTDVRAEFVADPFMLQRGSTWYLFFEVMDTATQHGYIGVATSSDGRSFHVRARRAARAVPPVLSLRVRRRIRRLHGAGNLRGRRGPLVSGDSVSGGVDARDDPPFRKALRGFLARAVSRQMVDVHLDAGEQRAAALLRRRPPRPVDPASREPGRAREPPHRPARRPRPRDERPRPSLRPGRRTAYGRQVFAFEIRRLDETGYDEAPAGDGPVVGPSGSGWNRDRMHTVDAHPTRTRPVESPASETAAEESGIRARVQ